MQTLGDILYRRRYLETAEHYQIRAKACHEMASEAMQKYHERRHNTWLVAAMNWQDRQAFWHKQSREIMDNLL